jgi:hypothetical protein
MQKRREGDRPALFQLPMLPVSFKIEGMDWVLPHRWLERRLLTTGGRRVTFFTIAHSLYSLLAGGFEIALILRLTGSFERIVVFNLLFYVLLYLSFLGGTFLIRSGKASRGFRLDLLSQVCGCAYMMVCFNRLAHPAVLAGFFLFRGISEGLFWSTRHSALLYCVADRERDHWSLVLQTITIVLGVILPVLSGFAISYLVLPAPSGSTNLLPAGYFPVYALTGILALGSLVCSPYLTIPSQSVHLRRMASLSRVPASRTWVAYLALGAFVSFSVTISVGIMNFYVLKTEFNMGLFSSWIALASAAFFFGIRRLLRTFNLTRVKLVLAGSSGEFLSRLVYFFFPTVTGLVGKSLLDSFILPLRGLFGENIIRRRIELLTASRGLSLAEGILFQETVLFMARVFCCLVLIAVLDALSFDAVTVARAFLLVFLAYSIFDFNFIRMIDRGNRKLTKESPEI